MIDAINSVIQQSFSSWELIIVDDGSTDDTKGRISELNDSRIKYLFQKNAERSAARNNGIRHALGKYVCFLDDDDQYLPNHLQLIFDFLNERQFPVAMIFTDYLLQKFNDEPKEHRSLFNGNPITYFLQNPVIPSCVCIHRNVFEKFQFDEQIKVVEDTVLWIKIATSFPIYHLNKISTMYFLHSDNSVSLKKNAFQDRLNGLQKLFKEIDRKTIPYSLRREVISGCYYGIGKYYYLSGQFFPMVYALFKSFIMLPDSPHNKSKLYIIKCYFFGPRIEQF